MFATLCKKTGLSTKELTKLLDCSERTLSRWEGGEIQPKKPVVSLLESYIENKQLKSRKVNFQPAFKFIDLFAGIGGLRRGFDALGGECVFTSEWNKYSQQTYLANYHDAPHHVFAGDITQVEAADIPEHDVLLAGFPCQPFSLAGVSKKNSMGKEHGFKCEAQGTLFFDVARIIEHHRPRAFLLENVKNLVNHDKGNTFRVIRSTLEKELGYNISWRIIDAKSFVPQHRERIFIVGFRDDTDFSLNDLIVPDVLSGPKMSSILHADDGREKADKSYVEANGFVNKKYILSNKLWEYLQGYAEKHRLKGNGFGFGLVEPNSVARTLSARYHKDGSEILVSRGKGNNPRRLTPRECARLMGFDAPRESEFIIPVSDTQAYRQFGNAVVVPVANAVANHMAPYIMPKSVSKLAS